jgi:hypothetical protein
MNIYKRYKNKYTKIRLRDDELRPLRNMIIEDDIKTFLPLIGNRIVFYNENSTYKDTEVNKIVLNKLSSKNEIEIIFSSYSESEDESEKKVLISMNVQFTIGEFIEWINNYIGYNYLDRTIKSKIEDTEWEILDKKTPEDDYNFINRRFNYFMKTKNKYIFNKLVIKLYTFIMGVTKKIKNIDTNQIPVDNNLTTIHITDFNKITIHEADLYFDIVNLLFIYDSLEDNTSYDNIKASFFDEPAKKKKKMRQQTILDYFKKVNVFGKESSEYSSDLISDDDTSSEENTSQSDSEEYIYNKYNICLEDTNGEYYLY